jgi:glucosamine--fructose-6-phosphate aminotransferase (isomerizing)
MNASEGDKRMLLEILNQPNAWAATLDVVKARADHLLELAQGIDEVVFTGCGSGLNAGVAIAPAFQHFTGIRARAVPAAEILFFPETVFVEKGRYLVISISRSGSTTETVKAQDVANSRGMQTLAITCFPDSPLAHQSSQALVLEAANEASVTTTQSLTSMILCGQAISAIISKNAEYLRQLEQLPQLGQSMMDRHHDLGRRVGENETLIRFGFVASGSLRGVARESQLKVKEMTLLPSDSYPLLDYRHGPKATVDEHALITVLSSDRTRAVEGEFLAEMKGLNGRLLVVCDEADAKIKAYADYVAEVNSGLPDFARDILYMPPIHFLAYYKSLALGHSPSSPAKLSYWVETASIG